MGKQKASCTRKADKANEKINTKTKNCKTEPNKPSKQKKKMLEGIIQHRTGEQKQAS